ncbi:MAG: TetR/AcrR family transcriptional regulator [Planctomycetes bacterium]|nr:TetR/AcrR family transcriptional regulator [Planctomycetota bacterium]
MSSEISNEQTKSARERLIVAAKELFHTQGYEATGVAQILTKAGVRSGSLYHFFKSKEELLQAVLDWYRDHLWPVVMWPIFARVTDPIERIFTVLQMYREALIGTGFTFGCPIGNLALELAECQPATRERIANCFNGWRQAIRQCLELAREELSDDVNLNGLAGFVLVVMEGGIMQSRSHRAIEPYDEAVAQLRDYFNRLMCRVEEPVRSVQRKEKKQ